MSREALVEIVAAMRQAQKEFFRDPTFSRLGVARDCERRCDQALASLKDYPALFCEHGGENDPA